jgi:acyl-CoA synthetase (AMP-forming)/AMP-acid ligase II
VSGNLAERVLAQAARHPSRVALVIAAEQDETVTYAGLVERIRAFSGGLAREGLGPGDRVALLFPLSVDFYALTLAVLARGATVVLMDGALGLRRTLVALRISRARAIVSVRAALRLWPVLPATWGVERFCADDAPFGTRPLATLRDGGAGDERPLARTADDEALVTFTSGSSGRPKGVDRTHGLLVAQHEALRAEFPEADGDVDMPCFPAVALHNMCCGMTTVIPPLDLRMPATSLVPERVLDAMGRFGVTRLSGAPAYMDRLVAAIPPGDPRAAKLRGLVVGGAPVPRRLCAAIVGRFERAEALVAYGSTEAEPIATVSMREVAESAGDGYLVGEVAPVARVELVRLPEIAPALGREGFAPYRAPVGESGEVVVSGPHVNRRYIGDDEAMRRLKVPAADGVVWHRTGDLARRDERGRLWLTGRTPDVVTHAGGAISPYVVEAAVDDVEGVDRAALVAYDGACLAVTLRGSIPRDDVLVRVKAVLAQRDLGDVPVRVVADMPVDARHQSKIDRAGLRALLAR